MAKLKLRPIKDGNDKNRYCGPAVISALTELTTGEAARLLRLQTGQRAITGTAFHEVINALKACNITSREVTDCPVKLHRKNGPTLAKWLEISKQERTPCRVFLIVAGWHWQLVSGRKYTCGRIREIVSIKDKRVKRRARVSKVYELTSDNVTRPSLNVTKPKDRFASVRAKCRRIEKQIGAEIELWREYGDLFVYPPKSICDTELDPNEGEHHCNDWDEALRMLLQYKKIIEAHDKNGV